ncbi:MAG: cell wall hydrolase [Clostridia bacterium]|nr:cell wall hydrolase [Clostridia bacterium]
MRGITKKIHSFFEIFPRDVKQTLFTFVVSVTVMSTLLFTLAFVISEENVGEERIVTDFCECGLEPYIEAIEDDEPMPVALEVIECGTAEDIELALLARAIDKAVPNEIYAVRVAVGAVLLNRCDSDAFPSSLSAVIRSAELYPDSFESDLPERTEHAARDAFLGVDPTMGALYVMKLTDKLYDEYSERICAIYGDYVFLK